MGIGQTETLFGARTARASAGKRSVSTPLEWAGEKWKEASFDVPGERQSGLARIKNGETEREMIGLTNF
jgi:hypothetical protein